jgi:uncharacterized protein YcfJ
MNKWLKRIILTVVVGGLSAPVLAGGRSGGSHYDYARVLRVDPMIDVVRVAQPREVCWTEQVTHRRSRGYNSATPEILGGIIGGVVGNQFGHGRGKDVATVAGAILGGSIAHDMERRRRTYGYAAYTEPVQRCRVEQDYYEQERIVGYDVTYRYNGEVYHTRMDHDPGRRVRVRVDVGVAE